MNPKPSKQAARTERHWKDRSKAGSAANWVACRFRAASAPRKSPRHQAPKRLCTAAELASSSQFTHYSVHSLYIVEGIDLLQSTRQRSICLILLAIPRTPSWISATSCKLPLLRFDAHTQRIPSATADPNLTLVYTVGSSIWRLAS